MKARRNNKRIINFCLAILIFMLLHTTSNAQEISENQAVDIVILLDSSQSMTNVDNDYMSIEFVRQLVCAVPSYYRIGIVAYNEEVFASSPIGSNLDEINAVLNQVTYKKYGNAGEGLSKAVSLFEDDTAQKKIIVVSDGENLMKTAEQTETSLELFADAVSEAKNKNIQIDIINLGKRIEEENNIYAAAEETGGVIYDLESGSAFEHFAGKYIFQDLKIPGRPVGKISGINGELKIELPDCLMDKAKIILTGSHRNENFVVDCEAENIEVLKGNSYTILNIEQPVSDEISIQISSETGMDIDAYLVAEYTFAVEVESNYFSDLQQAEIVLDLENQEGKKLLSGHLAEGGVSVLLNGLKCDYQIREQKIILNRNMQQDEELEIEILFEDTAGVYYGNRNIKETITIPVAEEEEKPQIDWFFWSVIMIFIILLLFIFLLAGKKQNRSSKAQKTIE